MKPIIGINLDITKGIPLKATIQTLYLEAIQKAGGLPVLLPPMPNDDLEQVLMSINGLMLIGGLDYNPNHYGEKSHNTVELLHPMREEFDLRLIMLAMRNNKMPILGICGGCQLINIGLSGSLVQDIPSEFPQSKVQHAPNNNEDCGIAFGRHPVNVEPNSSLAKIYPSEQFTVPTSHHQSVKKLGLGLKATAYASDGVVEAIEHSERAFTVGVQWHPERDFEGNRKLFQTFIESSYKNLKSE